MKISVYAHNDLGETEQFSIMKKCGFDGCDMSLMPYFHRGGRFDINTVTDAEIKEHFTMLRKEAEKADFEICQVHSAFTGHPSHYDYDMNEVIKRQIASIKAAHYLGTKLCVIHPIITPGRRYDLKLRESFDESVEFYRQLIPTLEEYDVYCCIENMWQVDPVYGHICTTILSHASEMVEMCEVLGDRFKICLDVGHGLLTQDDPVEMLRVCGDKLGCLHVHDNDGISDLHTFPYSYFNTPYGTGWKPLKMDWNGFMKALGEVGYNGTFSFEIGVPAPDRTVEEAGLTYLAVIGRYLTSLIK